ncbi:MAG: response regulator [Planctomycetales bacterium]
MALDENSPDSLTKTVIHNILVVEDEPDIASCLRTMLQEEGFQVTVAKDGGQAHSSFVMRKPDFVILDLILPGESGFEVCDHFKKTDATVPVLILSAIDLPESKALAHRVGSEGYLTKPFERRDLLKKISEIGEAKWRQNHALTGESENRDDDHIRFACRCGKRFKVKVQHRGKTLTCSGCGEPVAVPRV